MPGTASRGDRAARLRWREELWEKPEETRLLCVCYVALRLKKKKKQEKPENPPEKLTNIWQQHTATCGLQGWSGSREQTRSKNTDRFQVEESTKVQSEIRRSCCCQDDFCWSWVCLADRLQCGPGVCPANLQRRVVGEDVVAELLQRRLRIRRGKLRRLLHLLTDRHVDFLMGPKGAVLMPPAEGVWRSVRCRRSP